MYVLQRIPKDDGRKKRKSKSAGNIKFSSLNCKIQVQFLNVNHHFPNHSATKMNLKSENKGTFFFFLLFVFRHIYLLPKIKDEVLVCPCFIFINPLRTNTNLIRGKKEKLKKRKKEDKNSSPNAVRLL